MKKTSCVVLFLVSLAFSINAQDLQLFILDKVTKSETESAGFTSVSDTYRVSNHPDSLPLPDEIPDGAYFKLDAKYRKRLLSGTGISENDKVFIYDYSQDILVTLAVKDLDAVARLNIYTSPEECPCPQYYYMIGFEISTSLLKDFGENLSNTLVYFGKTNPFVRGKLVPITWKKADPEKYKSLISGLKDTAGVPNFARGEVYAFETKEYQYFVQDESRDGISRVRHLLILESKTKSVVYKNIYSDSEGSSLAPLNGGDFIEQWTGQLFKEKPTVVFGFVYESFSCVGITVLDKPVSYIDINCDARH